LRQRQEAPYCMTLYVERGPERKLISYVKN
jgi:hypothetical protein